MQKAFFCGHRGSPASKKKAGVQPFPIVVDNCVMLTQFSHTPHYQGSRSWGTSYRHSAENLIVRPCSHQYWTPGPLVSPSAIPRFAGAGLSPAARVGADQRHGRFFPLTKISRIFNNFTT
jgi:hypothetical protein